MAICSCSMYLQSCTCMSHQLFCASEVEKILKIKDSRLGYYASGCQFHPMQEFFTGLYAAPRPGGFDLLSKWNS